MNFTPKTSIRCNQSKLSANLTVEDTEKHFVRLISFPDFVGIGTEILDLQQDLDTSPRLGLPRSISLHWVEGVLYSHTTAVCSPS